MVEGKTLAAFRDVVVIVGVLILCACEMQAYTARVQARREQSVRFALSRNAVAQLDEAYKRLIANRPAPEQVFRQNEMIIEYAKLALTMPYVPVPVATTKPAAARPAQPGAAPPAAEPSAPAPSTPEQPAPK